MGALGSPKTSTIALSANDVDLLPAASLMVAVAVNSSFSATSIGTLMVTTPASRSSWVKVYSTPFTSTMSPTAMPVVGKPTLTSTSPAATSSDVIVSSPLPISTKVGAEGAMVSTVASAETSSDLLPAASLMLTSTSKVLPSAGASTLTMILPATMSSAVKTVSSPLTITLSPAITSAGKSILTSTLPSASISSAEIHSSPLPMVIESGAEGSVVSTAASAETSLDSLPSLSLIITSTSKVSPSFGASTLTVISPAAMSSAVRTVSSPLTITLSPATASAGKSILTSTLPFISISSAVIHSSPLPMVTESGLFGVSPVPPVFSLFLEDDESSAIAIAAAPPASPAAIIHGETDDVVSL